ATQTLRHTPGADEAPSAMGVGKAGGRIGEEEVAGERQLQASREADAMDGRDDGLVEKTQTLDHAWLEGSRLDRGPAHRLEIRARAEAPASAAQRDTPDAIWIPFQIGDVRLQLLERLGVERVELVRTIQRQRAEAVAVVSHHAFGHGSIPME